jgi:DNA repair protein RecN (Recombination protein N)
MLRFLSIQNLAVIERVQVEFDDGLSVLTGETGAGKSILVEALGLLLGGRASPDLVRTGEDTAVVEAIFDTEGGAELVVRREITAQGRSRAFIDGALATAASLRELGARLVDLHGQHEHQALLDPQTHLDLLDRFAGADQLRAEVAAAWTAWAAARGERDRMLDLSTQRAARLELIDFQLAELDRVAPRPGEDEELSALRALLASAEKVRRLADEGYELLYDRDDAVMTRLGQVWKRIGELAALDARFTPYMEARDGVKSQLEDLAAFLRGYAAEIDASPARLQEVEDRLAALERLKRKYGPTLADVIDRRRELSAERDALDSLAGRLAEAESECDLRSARYLGAAKRLSDERRRAANRFSQGVVAQLRDLAMEHTRFEVRFLDGWPPPPAEWTERGADTAEFYVSPNPGEDLRPLSRVVSGGEMSRIMLAIKSLASIDAAGKTLVFDEVDAGIGGRVADAVGGKLQALGASFQVLCITHLPQIAACGARHYRISKRVEDGRTLTTVEPLDTTGREAELARMLGGAQVSDAARAAAREMLARRMGESEAQAKGESERSRTRSRR